MTGRTDLQIAFTPPLADRIDRYFVELGLGVNAWRLAHERRDILLWLNAQTDADLAGMGMTRADIPAHVFRDLFS
jgi:hypothetical protein